MKTVLLTGATGLIGSYLLKLLLQKDHTVYVIARSKDKFHCRDRVIKAVKFWDNEVISNIHRLHVIEGDVSMRNFGLGSMEFNSLAKDVSEIFHCAAVINYSWGLKDIRKVNVLGTKRVLDFAVTCRDYGTFTKVNHISSAYVCGDYTGVFKEDDLDVGQKFNTTYEKSKFEAEKLIRGYRDNGLWIDIFRAPIVVGESTTGKTPVLQQHLYQVLRIWSRGIFDFFPIKDYLANIVPVNDLSESLVTISSNTSVKNGNYHLFRSERIYLENMLDLFKRYMGLKKPIAISYKQILETDFTPAQKIILKNLFFTFNGHVKLESRITEKLLRKYGFRFSKINDDLFYNIFDYWTKIN